MNAINEFPLHNLEVSDIRFPVAMDSTSVVEKVSKWNLDMCGVMLYVVSNFDKHHSKWRKRPFIYLFPSDKEQMIQDLAEFSLRYTIARIAHCDYEYKIYIVESQDGSTNIDASVMDAFSEAANRKQT